MIKVLRDWTNRHFSDPQVVIMAFLLIAGFLFIITMGDMLTPVLAGAVIAYLLEGIVALLSSAGVRLVPQSRRSTPGLGKLPECFCTRSEGRLSVQ